MNSIIEGYKSSSFSKVPAGFDKFFIAMKNSFSSSLATACAIFTAFAGAAPVAAPDDTTAAAARCVSPGTGHVRSRRAQVQG